MDKPKINTENLAFGLCIYLILGLVISIALCWLIDEPLGTVTFTITALVEVLMIAWYISSIQKIEFNHKGKMLFLGTRTRSTDDICEPNEGYVFTFPGVSYKAYSLDRWFVPIPGPDGKAFDVPAGDFSSKAKGKDNPGVLLYLNVSFYLRFVNSEVLNFNSPKSEVEKAVVQRVVTEYRKAVRHMIGAAGEITPYDYVLNHQDDLQAIILGRLTGTDGAEDAGEWKTALGKLGVEIVNNAITLKKVTPSEELLEASEQSAVEKQQASSAAIENAGVVERIKRMSEEGGVNQNVAAFIDLAHKFLTGNETKAGGRKKNKKE